MDIELLLCHCTRTRCSVQQRVPLPLVSRSEIQFSRHSEHQLDVAGFLAVYAAAHRHARKHPANAAEHCDLCTNLWARAATLYRGNFLIDLSAPEHDGFEDWRRARQEMFLQSLNLPCLT